MYYFGHLSLIFILFVIATLIADLIYFEHSNKHIGYEAYVFLGKDLILILGSILEESKFIFSVGNLGLASLTFLSFWIYKSITIFLKKKFLFNIHLVRH
jgi:hypothetical protein